MNDDFMKGIDNQIEAGLKQLRKDYDTEWAKYQARKAEFTTEELHLLVLGLNAVALELFGIIEEMK